MFGTTCVVSRERRDVVVLCGARLGQLIQPRRLQGRHGKNIDRQGLQQQSQLVIVLVGLVFQRDVDEHHEEQEEGFLVALFDVYRVFHDITVAVVALRIYLLRLLILLLILLLIVAIVEIIHYVRTLIR